MSSTSCKVFIKAYHFKEEKKITSFTFFYDRKRQFYVLLALWRNLFHILNGNISIIKNLKTKIHKPSKTWYFASVLEWMIRFSSFNHEMEGGGIPLAGHFNTIVWFEIPTILSSKPIFSI